jgi:hypothetical protein
MCDLYIILKISFNLFISILTFSCSILCTSFKNPHFS